MSDTAQKLAAPFDPARVSWRVGSTTQAKDKGMALAYIDSRDVQDRLDAVVGPSGWQDRYPHAGQKTVCEIGIKIGDEWVWKSDGAGDSDVEAEKGALSDAFKRAAVKWGVGRYLYDIESPWVKIVQKGKSYVIDDAELPRLRKLLSGSDAPAPRPNAAAEPEERKSVPGITKIKEAVREAVRDLNACSDETQFRATLESMKGLATQVARDAPDWWIGPEAESGFKYDIIAAGRPHKIDCTKWTGRAEQAAQQKQAAE